MRLNPLHAELGYVLSGLGFAHVIAGDDTAAVPVLRRSIPEMPNWVPSFEFLTVALQRLGQVEEARQTAARVMAMVPRVTVRPEKWVMVAGAARDSFLAALRDAGVPP